MDKDVNLIWTEFQKELKSFISQKVRNEEDTNDLLQDVFIKIIRNIDKVNQAKNIKHYLYGIVRNTINDYFKKTKNTLLPNDINSLLSEEENNTLTTTIAECCIKPFIQKLPDKYKEALLITEFQDISQKQLAQQLNISYSGAKTRVQRGKEKLKELILNCCSLQSDKYGNIIAGEDKNCGCD